MLDGQAAEVAEVAAPGSELADRWQSEGLRTGGRVSLIPGRPGDECPECSGPLMWEPGRTVTYCGECKLAALPAAVAAHYDRQGQHGAEVATRAKPDAAAERAARVRLRAIAQRMDERVADFIDAFDPEDLTGGTERAALDYRAELAAYRREIGSAASESDLADIMQEITEVLERAKTTGVLDAIERHREAIERQAEMAERQAEMAEQQAADLREAERAEREATRQAAITARSQPRAIAPPARPRPGSPAMAGSGLGQTAVLIGSVIEKRRKDREQKLAQCGPCGYQHRKPEPAARRYWISTNDWGGQTTGQEFPNSPSVLACEKHWPAADNWISEQTESFAHQRGVRVSAVWTDLQ